MCPPPLGSSFQVRLLRCPSPAIPRKLHTVAAHCDFFLELSGNARGKQAAMALPALQYLACCTLCTSKGVVRQCAL